MQQIKQDTMFNTFVGLCLVKNIFEFLLLYPNYDECFNYSSCTIFTKKKSDGMARIPLSTQQFLFPNFPFLPHAKWMEKEITFRKLLQVHCLGE